MSAAAADQQTPQPPPHSLAMLHTAPSGQPYIGSPPPPPASSSNPTRAARVPLDKVKTGEGVTQASQDRRTLWLECQTAGFKVECEIKPEEDQQPDKKELVLRDSSKNVQSVVVEVDQSLESPSALVVLTLAPSAGASSPRYYHFHLALSHPSYSHLDVEKLKHVLRGWQQSSNGSIKAVIAPQLALSPSDPRPPAKAENYNPSDSTTWVPPFPVQVPPAPPVPATPAPAAAGEDVDAEGEIDAAGEADIAVDGGAAPSADAQTPAQGQKKRSSLSPSQPFKAGSPEALEDAQLLQNAASGDALFWNDTGRARRRSTLKVRSYAPGSLESEGESPMDLDGTGQGGERARTSKSPPKLPSSASAIASYSNPSSTAPLLSSNKRTLDADATAAKKRRLSASAPSPAASTSSLPSVGGHFTRGASAAAQQQQQLQQRQAMDLALVGNLPPLPSGTAAQHLASAPAPVGASITAPRPGAAAGPSTPSSSSFSSFSTAPASAHLAPTTPAYPYTPSAAPVPGSAPAGSNPAAGAPGSAAPTPLSVYSQLHDLYAYVAQLAPMVTESKGTIKRLELEGVEREREVRRLREEVMLLRSGSSPRGSQASLGDVGEAAAAGGVGVDAPAPAPAGAVAVATPSRTLAPATEVKAAEKAVEVENEAAKVPVSAEEVDAVVPTADEGLL